MIIQFFSIFRYYLIGILPLLLIGFFLSGLVHQFVPTNWVKRYLGRGGIIPILYSTLAGIILPICCVGALPVAISFYKKGSSWGPVLAFLVATPATSITALLVCYRFLGAGFTAYIFFSVILMGLAMGSVGNLLKVSGKDIQSSCAVDHVCGMDVATENSNNLKHRNRNYYFCSPHCAQVFADEPTKYIDTDLSLGKMVIARTIDVLKYAFIELPREIGLEVIIGLILAAIIATATPIGNFIGAQLAGGLGYLFSLLFGLLMYICSTASVPLVHAFISQGMDPGAGMVFLLVGPITSWATILVLRKEFGRKLLFIYLMVIITLSLLLGLCFPIISIYALS